jgi:hypothetical protein
MANANNLAAAMVMAPMAGLAAATLHFLKTRNTEKPNGDWEGAKNV